MSQEKPEDNSNSIEKIPGLEVVKPLGPEDVEIIHPLEPMSMKEAVEELEKQGKRLLTVDELKSFMERGSTKLIEPKDTDIVIEKPDKQIQKELPENASE